MGKEIKNIRNRIKIPPGCHERFLPLDHSAAEVLRDLGLCLSGVSEVVPGYEISYRCSPNHMIIGTVEGSGWFRTEAVAHKLTANTLLIAPAGQSFSFGVAQKRWRMVWFYLRDDPRWKPLKEHEPYCLHSPLVTRLEHALTGLLNETGWTRSQNVVFEEGWRTDAPLPPETPRSPSSRQDLLANRAGRFYAQITQTYLQHALIENACLEDGLLNRLQELWRLVQKHPEKDWGIRELCSYLHVSAPTLQRMVRKVEGCSPLQMVIRIRMEIAQRLLTQTNYPIQIIAQQIGYADQFGFSSAFKRAVGVSPREFRKFK